MQVLAENQNLVEPPADLIQRIALLTRTLRDSMRELGLDQAIKDAAYAIPDARDRLHYVAQMTEQAANRVLTAAEQMQPLQTELQSGAQQLQKRLAQALDSAGSGGSINLDAGLAQDLNSYFDAVSVKTKSSLDTIMEIIMAQDFQDLTGQVIMRMLGVVNIIETELVQVLIDSVPAERREETNELINGPQVNAAGKPDIVTDQDQVDDLLASLGL